MRALQTRSAQLHQSTHLLARSRLRSQQQQTRRTSSSTAMLLVAQQHSAQRRRLPPTNRAAALVTAAAQQQNGAATSTSAPQQIDYFAVDKRPIILFDGVSGFGLVCLVFEAAGWCLRRCGGGVDQKLRAASVCVARCSHPTA